MKYTVMFPAPPIAEPFGEINDMYHIEKTPRKFQFEENPPKYTTAYLVQQSNCRWHCEPTFFLRWAFNTEKSLHTLPL
jgi:hypothetical protein